MIREHDGVVLLRDLPEAGLLAGSTGVAVFAHKRGEAFEVEFPNPAGAPRFLVATVYADDLLKLQSPAVTGRS